MFCDFLIFSTQYGTCFLDPFHLTRYLPCHQSSMQRNPAYEAMSWDIGFTPNSSPPQPSCSIPTSPFVSVYFTLAFFHPFRTIPALNFSLMLQILFQQQLKFWISLNCHHSSLLIYIYMVHPLHRTCYISSLSYPIHIQLLFPHFILCTHVSLVPLHFFS